MLLKFVKVSLVNSTTIKHNFIKILICYFKNVYYSLNKITRDRYKYKKFNDIISNTTI